MRSREIECGERLKDLKECICFVSLWSEKGSVVERIREKRDQRQNGAEGAYFSVIRNVLLFQFLLIHLCFSPLHLLCWHNLVLFVRHTLLT